MAGAKKTPREIEAYGVTLEEIAARKGGCKETTMRDNQIQREDNLEGLVQSRPSPKE